MKGFIWFQIVTLLKLIEARRGTTSLTTPPNQIPISIPPWSVSGVFPPYPEGFQTRDCGVCHCEGNRFISCQEKDTLDVIPSFSTPGKKNVFQAM